jgi:hypothetical protein
LFKRLAHTKFHTPDHEGLNSFLKEERLPTMKLALFLTTVEVETEEDVETDAAEGATNDEFLALMRLPVVTAL